MKESRWLSSSLFCIVLQRNHHSCVSVVGNGEQIEFCCRKNKIPHRTDQPAIFADCWLQLVQNITSPGISNTAIRISATPKLTRKVFIKYLLKWLFFRRVRQVTPLSIIITPDSNLSNTKKIMSNHSSQPDFDANEIRAEVGFEEDSILFTNYAFKNLIFYLFADTIARNSIFNSSKNENQYVR